MGDKSDIQWTDATWNPTRGCDKVSPGCANCYAETFSERWRGVDGHPYEQGFDLRLVPESLPLPLRWTKPRRIFVNSMSDLFHKEVPDSYVDQVFGVMVLAPRHAFQVLTKRAERMRDYLNDPYRKMEVARYIHASFGDDAARKVVAKWRWPLPNVWLGVSVENQHFADERIPLLLQTPASVRFISAEPLLGPVHLHRFILREGVPGVCADIDGQWYHDAGDPRCGNCRPALDWVIVGGESGPGARPFNLAWGRSLIAQCKSAGVPVFMKQLGADPQYANGSDMLEWVCKSRKGGDVAEWPRDLQVRQFPVVSV